jgi:hypothetical protein
MLASIQPASLNQNKPVLEIAHDSEKRGNALIQRAGTNDGGGIIEAEIHLAKRPKLFRQTEPALSATG